MLGGGGGGVKHELTFFSRTLEACFRMQGWAKETFRALMSDATQQKALGVTGITVGTTRTRFKRRIMLWKVELAQE